MKSLFSVAAVAAAVFASLAMSAGTASAVTATCTSGKHMVSFSEVAANDASNVFCGSQPSYSGGAPHTADFFGTTYTLSSKSDENKGDGTISFTDPLTNSENSGTWSLGDLTGIDSVVIGFKKSRLYAAFLVSSTSGTWQIKSNGNVNNDYSHLDVWYKPGETTAIPLPATLPLLFVGLAALGLLGRRRRAA